MLARYNDPDQLEQAQQRFALRPGAINQAVTAAAAPAPANRWEQWLQGQGLSLDTQPTDALQR